jgi:hypothetical protein
MKHWPLYGIAIVTGACALPGCAASSGTVPTAPFAARHTIAAYSAGSDAKVPVSGTYKGSFTESEGGKERSGSIEITIEQSGKTISGEVDLKTSSGSAEADLTGSVKSDGAKKAKITFTVENPHGRDAYASATVSKKKLVGKATVPPSSKEPGVKITFKTTRSKTD